ncbi:MAG: hypothetical protein RMM17_04525 [Acidobacteriota bacterium]|nr:hypothetical protein [Blastocatellia bacterium]MDW8411928.1 hypothetical protein [Acidobacteriota bacterium]
MHKLLLVYLLLCSVAYAQRVEYFFGLEQQVELPPFRCAYAALEGNNSEEGRRGSGEPAAGSAGSSLIVSQQEGFRWKDALIQSMRFLIIQHSFRLLTEKGTRDELAGPFLRDYFRTLKRIKGWDDGDPFLVNYVGHPMMGAVGGYIQIHNDPAGPRKLAASRRYLVSRLKALGWSAAYSTQFEIGPISEASIGNVGIRPTRRARNPMALVDLVVTPTLGVALIVGEDAIDKYFIEGVVERYTRNRAVRALARGFLNPCRSFANMLRLRWMWYRDTRSL